jgi:hypothetical protein
VHLVGYFHSCITTHGFMNIVISIYLMYSVRSLPYDRSIASCKAHSEHQPAATWVDTTRYCKYSQVLLMMGKNIARYMQH